MRKDFEHDSQRWLGAAIFRFGLWWPLGLALLFAPSTYRILSVYFPHRINAQWLGVVGSKQNAAAIALDGSGCTQDNGGSSSATIQCTLTVAAGSAICCSGAIPVAGDVVISLADATNGNYQVVHQMSNATRSNFSGCMQNSAAGSISPTVTYEQASAGGRMTCTAAKNTRTDRIFDTGAVMQEQVAATANPTSGTAQTPANNGELIYCDLVFNGGNTPTAGSTFSLVNTVASVYPEYVIQTTAAAVNCPYTLAAASYGDGQIAILPASASAPSNTPPTGAKFTERWTAGATSCGVVAGSTCDNTWSNGAGTPATLVTPTVSYPLNTIGTKVMQITNASDAQAYITAPMSPTITSGTTFDAYFSFLPVSSDIAVGSGIWPFAACATINSTCAFYVDWILGDTNGGTYLMIETDGGASSNRCPIQYNSSYSVHVHCAGASSTLAVTTIGGGTCSQSFTCGPQDTTQFVLGATGNAGHIKNFQIGAIKVD